MLVVPSLEETGAGWAPQFEIHSAKGQFAGTISPSSPGLTSEPPLRLSVAIVSFVYKIWRDESE